MLLFKNHNSQCGMNLEKARSGREVSQSRSSAEVEIHGMPSTTPLGVNTPPAHFRLPAGQFIDFIFCFDLFIMALTNGILTRYNR